MGVVLVPGQDEREGEDLGAGLSGLVDEVGQVVAAAVGGGMAAPSRSAARLLPPMRAMVSAFWASAAATKAALPLGAVLRVRKIRSQVLRTSTLLFHALLSGYPRLGLPTRL